MEIEEDSRSSPEICSNIIDSTKKRKLQSEQFDLPSSKHKCLDQGFTPSIRDNTKQDIDLIEECESRHESAKDSNSFAEVSDCAMSSYQNEQQYLCETIEDHLLEFGFDEDYSCFELEDKEVVEEDPYAVNRNNFILSSGRFDTIRETTAKPTIDREFEDYFAELMM